VGAVEKNENIIQKQYLMLLSDEYAVHLLSYVVVKMRALAGP